MNEMLQKTENVAKNVANENSQDLTEQWKKGELPDGYYYCKTENGAEILRTWRGIDGYLNFENMCNEVFISSMDDCEVLAEVPDYVEWRNMVNCACEEHEANKRFIEENSRLKELLEECSPYIGHSATSRMIKNSAGYKKDMKLLTKIDEVLK